ncbi:MAG: hypothetical protein RSB23_04310 [Alistipes sp.]
MKKALNILLGVLMAITVVLLVYALVSPHPEGVFDDPSISLNIIWCYFLLVFAIGAALFCALFGMIQNPAGIKGTIASLGLIIVIVGVAYFISAGHSIQIPNLASGGVFSAGETVLTETSIIVTYVAMVAAFVTAVATEIYGALK